MTKKMYLTEDSFYRFQLIQIIFFQNKITLKHPSAKRFGEMTLQKK